MIMDMSDKNMEQNKNEEDAVAFIGDTIKQMVNMHRMVIGRAKKLQIMVNISDDDKEKIKVYENMFRLVFAEDMLFSDALTSLGDELLKTDGK